MINVQIGGRNSCSYDKINEEKTMQEEMELQLHEQYAINNNSNLSSVVSLIVAMIAVFYGYGYIFLHTTNFFSNGLNFMCCSKDMYTLDALIITAIAVFIVTGILRRICLTQGYTQRFEQFITFALRCIYYDENINKMKKRVFPSSYHPFKIKPCCREKFESCLESNCMKKDCLRPYIENNIAQGLFGEFAIILCWVDVVVIFSLIVRIIINLAHSTAICFNGTGCLEIYIFLMVWIFVWCENSSKRDELRDKYLEKIIEYKEYYQYTL